MFFVTYLNCILLLFVGLLGVISVQSKKCVSLMYYFRMKSANPQTIFPQNGAPLMVHHQCQSISSSILFDIGSSLVKQVSLSRECTFYSCIVYHLSNSVESALEQNIS